MGHPHGSLCGSAPLIADSLVQLALRLLQENMVLVQEIATLRQELKAAMTSRGISKQRTLAKRASAPGTARTTKDSIGAIGGIR